MKTAAIDLLKQLTEAHSVSGFETEVRQLFIKKLNSFGEISADRNGSIRLDLSGVGPQVLVTAHMDEVGFMVQHITAEGMIQFVTLGGWWEHQLPTQRVEIKTQKGAKILGVIASTPPHFLAESQRRQVMSIEQMMIDVGASTRAEVEALGICLGDPIAPLASFESMACKDRFVAKAFDNRVGMAALIQAGQLLQAEDLKVQGCIVASVQEELGLRGAKTMLHGISPQLAIVLEGAPADDTMGSSRASAQGRLGGGVQIRLFDPTAIANPRLAQWVVQIANQENIPHQVAVRRTGGTDAGAIHLSQQGIPTIVLSVPARYIHSHSSIVDINDYLAMLQLTVALMKHLDERSIQSFSDYQNF